MSSSSFGTTLYASNGSDVLKNEFLITLGIAIVGGAVGFTYQFIQNRKNNVALGSGIENDFITAFEGALVGIIISVLSIVIYRIVYHARSTSAVARRQATSVTNASMPVTNPTTFSSRQPTVFRAPPTQVPSTQVPTNQSTGVRFANQTGYSNLPRIPPKPAIAKTKN